jgi:hypothetical protein
LHTKKRGLSLYFEKNIEFSKNISLRRMGKACFTD